MKNQDSEECQRIDRKREVLSRVRSVLSDDPRRAAAELVDAALSILASAYPGSPSSSEIKHIKKGYKGATEQLIKERSMSELGVACALYTASLMGSIAIDYSPLGYVKNDIVSDGALQNYIHGDLSQRLESAFNDAIAAGVSPFGVTSVMTLSAAKMAMEHQVPVAKIARPLVEAVAMVLKEQGYDLY